MLGFVVCPGAGPGFVCDVAVEVCVGVSCVVSAGFSRLGLGFVVVVSAFAGVVGTSDWGVLGDPCCDELDVLGSTFSGVVVGLLVAVWAGKF